MEGEILKKILFAASTFEHINNFHITYLRELNKRCLEVHVLSNKLEDIIFAYKIISSNFQKRIISILNIKEIFKIKKLIKEEKYKEIIVHTTLAGFIVRMAVKLLKEKPKIIYMSHGYLFTDSWSLKNKFYLLCEKLVANVTDILIVMNEEDLKIANKYKLGKQIFFTNGIGLNTENFKFNNNEKEKNFCREQFNLNKEDIIFTNVAEFSKRKNQKELIYAISKVNNKKIKLVLAGIGKELDKCKKLCKKLRLEERIYFLGYVKDVEKLYIASDYYISASKSEGIPFSVLEAASSGLPLLLSNKKGHKDIIKSARGLVFNDINDLIRKINDVLIYKKEKNNLKKYNIDVVKDKIIDIYTDIR